MYSSRSNPFQPPPHIHPSDLSFSENSRTRTRTNQFQQNEEHFAHKARSHTSKTPSMTFMACFGRESEKIGANLERGRTERG